MAQGVRLVIFDVDGTLVDSQNHIVSALEAAFAAVDQPAPQREVLLSIVGLSLGVAIGKLAPDLSDAGQAEMVRAYKDAYMSLRGKSGIARSSPLYPGARMLLDQLHATPGIRLGIATGKSARGLTMLLDAHELHPLFVTRQVADGHPSKPHPSMILQAMSETGVGPGETVMIGDTSFDMDMAAAAGVTGIGVSWGYHPAASLRSASHVIDSFAALPPLLEQLWRVRT